MITLDGLELPYELVWIDEYNWSGVAQNKAFTLGGTMVVEESQIRNNSGRPMTLESEEAWITKADLATLWEKAQVLGKIMHIVLNDDRAFRVMFDHSNSPVIVADPVKSIAEQGDTDEFKLSVKLMITPDGVPALTTTTTTTTT